MPSNNSADTAMALYARPVALPVPRDRPPFTCRFAETTSALRRHSRVATPACGGALTFRARHRCRSIGKRGRVAPARAARRPLKVRESATLRRLDCTRVTFVRCVRNPRCALLRVVCARQSQGRRRARQEQQGAGTEASAATVIGRLRVGLPPPAGVSGVAIVWSHEAGLMGSNEALLGSLRLMLL
jgi:hypothetical protein